MRRAGVTGVKAEQQHHFFSSAGDAQKSGPVASPPPAAPSGKGLPKVAFRGSSPVGPSGPTLPLGETLDFLEATPYWDQSNIPINVAKQKGVYRTPPPPVRTFGSDV